MTGPSLLAERVAALEPVASNETVQIVGELRASGRDVVSLYGSPWWLPPEHVLEAAEAAVRDNRGAPAAGLPELARAAAARLREEKGLPIDAESGIVVTNAGNHALMTALVTVLDPDDEVLTYSPHYYYQGLVELCGGVATYAHAEEVEGWSWNIEALRRAVTPRTKVVIVNTPANPTGYVASESDLAAIVALAAEHDLIIISDEAYDHTVYDGGAHVSIGSLAGAAERTLTAVSCTKSYALRHWRIGFLAGPETLISACRNVLEWNVFSCNHVAQHAALAALTGPQDWVAEISRTFESCRDLMVSSLAGVPGIRFARPAGGPFLFVGVHGLAENAERFRYRLLREHGVPTDAGRHFGAPDHLRLMFGGAHDDVSEAARRIAAATSAAGLARS